MDKDLANGTRAWEVIAWLGAVVMWVPVLLGTSFSILLPTVAVGILAQAVAIRKLRENWAQQSGRESLVFGFLMLGGALLMLFLLVIRIAGC